jgi:Protein kinase domain
MYEEKVMQSRPTELTMETWDTSIDDDDIVYNTFPREEGIGVEEIAQSVRRESIAQRFERTLSQNDIISKVLANNAPYCKSVKKYFSQSSTARFGAELLVRQPTLFITDAELLDQLSPQSEWKFIGKGSFGSVFKAVWMNITVAVKTPIVSQSSHDSLIKYEESFYCDFLQLFEEYEMARRIRHPCIVTFLISSPHYYVMEYIPHCLCDRMKGEEVDDVQKHKWMRQVASAMKYLHTFGFVHSDVKIDNIMLDETMNVKLIDMGAAYMHSEDGTDDPKYKIVSDRWTPLHLSVFGNDDDFGITTDKYALSLLYICIITWRQDVHAILGFEDFERKIDAVKTHHEKAEVIRHCMSIAVPRVIQIFESAQWLSSSTRRRLLEYFIADSVYELELTCALENLTEEEAERDKTEAGGDVLI